MAKKKDYREKILEVLEGNLFGLTITDIAKEAGVSRNTVYRYIGILKGQGEIYEKKVGSYTLYYRAGKRILSQEKLLSFFKGLLANIKKVYPNQEHVFQLIGRNMADSIQIVSKKESEEIKQKLTYMNEQEILQSIGDYLPYFNILHDTIRISKIEFDDRNKRALITFFNSELLESTDDYIYYFYVLIGIIEKKLSKFIDKELKFDIVDYETFGRKENSFLKMSLDIQVILPDLDSLESKDRRIPNSEELNVNEIKKIDHLILSYILSCIFLKENVILFVKTERMKHQLQVFIKFILQNIFQCHISIENVKNYENNNSNAIQILILEHNEAMKKGYDKIITNEEKVLKNRSIKVEKMIIENFINENNREDSLNLIRNEIKKASILGKSLDEKIRQLREEKEEGKIDSHEIIGELSKEYDIKNLSRNYLRFLTDIIESHYGTEIPKLWKFFLYI
ncbi:MAG: HTH domain-containing protein [Promethearchaeota archaeon]|nr:MAG: HTH domain-containing protein [Candidatus Lokiarchaeota archaeon]